MSSLKVRIIILNYNGQDLLPQCLPSIVSAAEKSSYPVTVTLLDNLSQDKGLEYAARAFPSVTVFHAKENRVLCSYNDYLPLIEDDIVILLNNDIRVESGFIDPLIKPFEEDADCFLAAPRVMSFDGKRVEAGRAKSGIRFGSFWCDARYRGYENDVMTPSDTASSGFGAFSRLKFIELGGYDPRFFPGIMEDVDLCLHARRKGFSLKYVPASVVYHMGQASFKKKYGSEKTALIAHRNNFLFMRKNLKTPGFLLAHFFFLPFRLLYALIRGNRPLLLGYKEFLKIR